MLIFLNIFIIFLLFIIAVQDFKTQKISWIAFPFLLTALILKTYYLNIVGFWISSILNLGFILINIILVQFYFMIKLKRYQPVIKHQMGLGDLLLFITLSFGLESISFVVFFVVSLIFSLLLFLLLHKKRKALLQERIPLAGILGINYIIVLVVLELLLNHPLNKANRLIYNFFNLNISI